MYPNNSLFNNADEMILGDAVDNYDKQIAELKELKQWAMQKLRRVL